MLRIRRSHGKDKKGRGLTHLRNNIAIFIAGYFIAGLATWKIGEHRLFPIFSWSLFSSIPQKNQETFDILIYSHTDQRPAIPFNRASNTMASGQGNIIAIKLIQKLGRAYKQKDMAKFKQLRMLFENNYLTGEVKYELISETYNPIVKLKTGASTTKRLASFISSSSK
ncbi:hypothetical protein [Acaryochloris sp. IP29b_bin.148]|uniref:hypothetical protein n=1 Tax=Acaryochloris sp. IP29b_bin.148 TaxID=2969218 RepID=UPI0026068315|nr:hypothetical protein [Acaryochloris sp. IP29b_bin.148]